MAMKMLKPKVLPKVLAQANTSGVTSTLYVEHDKNLKEIQSV